MSFLNLGVKGLSPLHMFCDHYQAQKAICESADERIRFQITFNHKGNLRHIYFRCQNTYNRQIGPTDWLRLAVNISGEIVDHGETVP